jgi:hypothetical protein
MRKPAGIVFALLLAATARAVIVDRIAVVIGDKVIAESEVEQRLRLEAFQKEQKPDLSLASRQRAVQELIDSRLIEREMGLGHYLRLDLNGKNKLVEEYEKADHTDAAGLARELSSYGLTLIDLGDELGRQADFLTFLNLRFRPAVQVTDQDIQKYFDTVSAGADKTRQRAQAGALNELRGQIEQKLSTERADKEMELWLQDQRKRTKIEFLEKDLEAKP